MKKGSGFEKFFKGKEKTGGAKKEAIRKEKREIRKEREEKIANAKRQKRAQYKTTSSNEPPKYNLEPPTSKYGKRNTNQPAGNRNKPSFKVEKQNATRPEKFDQKEQRIQKEGNRAGAERPQRFEPQKNRAAKAGDYQTDRRKSYGDRPGKDERFENNNKKPFDKSREKPVNAGRKIEPIKPVRREEGRNTVPLKAKSTTTKPLTDQMPLNKYIAHSGVCSRRDAVDLIRGGKVKVNGELILEPGHKVALTDDVRVGGRRMNPVKDFVYILLNKPKDYLTTTDDPQQRKTVLDLLSGAPDIRIYPVGRLDRNTSGVLLLTNDGDLSQKLTHPSNEIKKVYAVTLDKPLTRHHFDEILRGVPLEDGMAHVDVLAFTDAKDHTQIGVELHTGRNRIVRRIFEHFGYDVKGLDRVIFAGLTKKNVNRGKWRFLTEKEVRDLKFFKKGR